MHRSQHGDIFRAEMVQALFEEGALQRNGTVKLTVFFSAPALA
jgi:hypothetical protein